MRSLALVTILLVAGLAAPARAAGPPICDATRIGARELADCLRTASEKSEQALAAEVETALKSIEAKPKMLATRKARWKRFFNDSQAQWVSWRDEECQDLAPLEAPPGGDGDPRLSCIIDRNNRRVADLKERYP